LHLVPAALDRASATFGDDHLRAALGTDVDLADLVCHARTVLLSGAESGPAPFEKGANAFPTVGRRLQQHVQILLQPDALPERQVKRLDEREIITGHSGRRKQERAQYLPARGLHDALKGVHQLRPVAHVESAALIEK